MALSDDLTRLAARVNEAQAHAGAARTKAKADLEREIETARVSAETQADKLRHEAETGKTKVSVWWHDLQRTWREHLAKIRDDIDTKRAEHDLDRAQRRAERAEDDARFAIAFAYAAVEEADYAVLDAALARMEADELAQHSPTV